MATISIASAVFFSLPQTGFQKYTDFINSEKKETQFAVAIFIERCNIVIDKKKLSALLHLEKD